jgi:hypothetical protein
LIVAIHQPNYFPWLGYFHKIALADVFVFLDDVQYSKNSYTNRVQLLCNGKPKWLTIPVSFSFGEPITKVQAAKADWLGDHSERLTAYYSHAPHFAAVWPLIHEMLKTTPPDNLAAINSHLVKAIAAKLNLPCTFVSSSDLGITDARGDDRLIEIVSAIARGGTYLFGRGGANYQDEQKYREAGIDTRGSAFQHPEYPQGDHDFVPGLSVTDALFQLGWEGVSQILLDAAERHG